MSASSQQDHINPGTDVFGRNGDKLGSVAYVVVHPPEMHVTDVVVSTGAILGRDVVVPIGDVERVADDHVYLSISKDELQKLPDYVDVEYQPAPADWIPPGGFYYPAQSVLWPAGAYYPQPSSITVNAPSGTVGLHQGMEVKSSDGHKVGSIDGLDTDPSSGNLTAITIRHGFVFTHDTRIPASYIGSVDGGVVTLNVTGDEVRRLEDRTGS